MTVMETPALDQVHAALAKANFVRLARATEKKRIRDGETNVIAVLRATPDYMEGMTVLDLLMAQRRWGLRRASTVLTEARVSQMKTIGGLTQRQRDAITYLLRGRS